MTRQPNSDNRDCAPLRFALPDTDIALWPHWLDGRQADAMLNQLEAELSWKQEAIMMFGKRVLIPRQQVWMGDAHCSYRYSGTTFIPEPWHPLVWQLTSQVSTFLHQPFNCVLLNYYANGQQHMGWHADNESELGHDPLIASLSLGASRRFELKHRSEPWQLALELRSGSLLQMGHGCQANWLHRLPKQIKVLQGRLNLTFRYIEDKT